MLSGKSLQLMLVKQQSNGIYQLNGVCVWLATENEWAFDLLYCVAFVVMDKQWLEKSATYMEFNVRKKLNILHFPNDKR